MGVIIRQGFKASISNYIGLVLGFVSLYLLQPKFYEPEELGAIRIFIELGTVLSAFSLVGTHYSINRFFPFFRTSDQKNHGFFFWAFSFPLFGYTLLIIVLAFFGTDFFTFINPKASQYESLLPLLLILIFITLYQTVTEVSCANHGRITVPNFMREVVTRILIIIAGMLYYFKFISFYASMWMIVSAYFIALCGNLWFLSKLTTINLKPDMNFLKKNPELKKDVFKFTLLLFFSGIAALVVPKIDLFLISSIRENLAEVAIYSVGFYLATFIEVPKRTILQIANPIISKLMREEKFDEVESLNKKNGTNQLLISGILFFLIWLNIDNLYALMPKGEIYVKGKWVVFYIGISKMIDALVCGNSPIITNSKFYSLSAISIVVAAVSSILFNYVLISKFGLIGGAISTILVMLCVNLCNLLLLQFKLNINPFDSRQIRIALVLGLFICSTFIGPWLNGPIIDSVVKTLVMGSLLIFTLYKLKVSDEFNELLSGKMKHLFKF